jgi:branched-chain amino acid transport system substrate-binding protein
MNRRRTLIVAAGLVCAAASASAQELRIGFLNTLTGPGALIGTHIGNGWKLGLEHEGWTKDGDKLGGVPTRIFYGDDQAKTDVGVTVIDKFIKQDKVQIVSGVIWSNVLLAIQKPVFEAGIMLVGSNAGPSPLAGSLCNPLFVSMSRINDGPPRAVGEMATRDGIKSIATMAPNYQTGKEMLGGFEAHYKGGAVVERILFKLGESDFQPDLAKVRAKKPQALVIFAPGAMGVAFMKQWFASGLNKEIRLYSLFIVDQLTLPAIGEAGIGATEVSEWNPDGDNEKNNRFKKDYVAKFNQSPSYYAVGAYDSAIAIANGMRATGGKHDDMAAVARAIRKAPFVSPRGTLRFNVNGFLVQPYWRLEVLKGSDGAVVIRGREKLMEAPDVHWPQCPEKSRI